MANVGAQQSLASLIKTALAGAPSPVIVEAGVHHAESTAGIMSACRVVPRYFGFEPDPRNIAEIKSAMAELPFPLTLIESALGDTDGELAFHQSSGICPQNGKEMTGAGSICKPHNVRQQHPWITFDKQVAVKCVTLDSFCRDNKVGAIDFIWADLQGAEYRMLQGAARMLRTTRAVLLEYSEHELYAGQRSLDDCLVLLRQSGDWELVQQFRCDAFFANASDRPWPS